MKLRMLFIEPAKMVAKLTSWVFLVFSMTSAQANNCYEMAEMATNIAQLRDAGIPLAVVEKRLKRDVIAPEELGLGLIVARLVYQTNGTAQQLKKAILEKCQ